MNRWTRTLVLLALFAAAGTVRVAGAVRDRADVYLKDGTTLRGDVSFTAGEIVIRNAAGQVSYPRIAVERVVWADPPADAKQAYHRKYEVLAPRDVQGHLALARELAKQGRLDLLEVQCKHILSIESENAEAQRLLEKARTREPATRPASATKATPDPKPKRRDSRQGLIPPPLLSKKDINRIRLAEYDLDGPAENVRVHFVRERREKDVEQLVQQALERDPAADPDALRTLKRGKPYEKLQVVLNATGLKYADRIETRGDPQKFREFRRRVLPLVVKSCGRSGCHSGANSRGFRMPAAPQSGDAYAYTSFYVLTQIQTRDGPLLDRALPEASALLRYLLPAASSGKHPHPPLPAGRLRPGLRSTRDPNYERIALWINSLNYPTLDYGISYERPDWLVKLATPPEPAPPTSRPVASRPAASRPARP